MSHWTTLIGPPGALCAVRPSGPGVFRTHRPRPPCTKRSTVARNGFSEMGFVR